MVHYIGTFKNYLQPLMKITKDMSKEVHTEETPNENHIEGKTRKQQRNIKVLPS